MSRIGAAGLVAAATILVAPAPGAWAHAGVPGMRNVLDAVDPAIPRVTVQVVASVADQVVLSNESGTEVSVLDDGGRPFLRIGPDGVLGDLGAVAWYRTNDPSGAVVVPARAGPGAPAQWAHVSTEHSWGWFDHRLHPQPLERPPPFGRGGRKPVRLGSWVIPLRWGDRLVALRGHREYRPPQGAFRARLADPVGAPGVEVDVLPGRVPGLFLSDTAGAQVSVLGASGEPFARLGPGGAEVNMASPTWSLTAASRGQVPDGVVGATTTPRWQLLAPVPRMSWLEPRALYPRDEPPHVETGPVDLLRWRVPLVVDGKRIDVVGVTSWVPFRGARASRGGGGRGPVISTGLGVGGGLVALVAARQWRKRRKSGGRFSLNAVTPSAASSVP